MTNVINFEKYKADKLVNDNLDTAEILTHNTVTMYNSMLDQGMDMEEAMTITLGMMVSMSEEGGIDMDLTVGVVYAVLAKYDEAMIEQILEIE